ncbi:MAG: septum formation initiator family protein [Rickettsiales bacterium]|nr:septum formation initiator family protein [Rickettsiales bacterium]
MAITKKNILYKLVSKYSVPKRLFIVYFVALAVILYFLFFTLFGQKGLFKLLELEKIISNKESIKKDYQEKVEAKKRMVDGMKPGSLDVDLLDEQTRRNLGYVGKNEVVIYEEGEENDE